jgi:hypothetical protein
LLTTEFAPASALADEERPEPNPYDAAVVAYGGVVPESGEAAPFDEFLTAVARSACRLLGASRCALFLSDGVGGLFHGGAGYPEAAWEQVRNLTCGGMADGFTRELLRRRQPVVIVDAANDSRPVHRAMVRHNVRDVLGAPLVAGADVIGVLFVDNCGERRTFSDADRTAAAAFTSLAAVGITQARSSQRLRARVEELERSVKTHRRMRIIDGHFDNLIEAGPSPQEIAAMASMLTEKPCSIHAVDGRCVAQASPGGPSDPMPRILQPDMTAMPEVATALAAISPGSSAIIGPYPALNIMHRCLVSPFEADDAVGGHVAILEIWRRLTRADQAIVERAARTLTFQLRVRGSADFARGNASISDSVDLDGLDLNRRAVLPGPTLKADRCVCLVRRRDGGPCGAEILSSLEGAFDRHHAPGVQSRASISGCRKVALIVERSEGSPHELSVAQVGAALEAALSGLSGSTLIGTVSSVARRIGDLQTAYCEAEQLMHCLTKACPDGVAVLTAQDLGVGRLILGAADRRSLDQFVTDALGALLAADGRHRDLLETLHIFLEASRSPRGAGQRLNVHENTVRYRLAKVVELTGLDVASNHDDQLTAQLAILVLRVRGQLPGYDARGNRVATTGASAGRGLDVVTRSISSHQDCEPREGSNRGLG